jgi:hypothetical protein
LFFHFFLNRRSIQKNDGVGANFICLFVTMRPAGTRCICDVFANYTGTILQVSIIIPSTRSTLPPGLVHFHLKRPLVIVRPWKDHFKSDLRSDQDHRQKNDLRSFKKIISKDHFKRSFQKIISKDHFKRSFQKIISKDHFKRSFQKNYL